MSQLPPDKVPLNRHSLMDLEYWLDELGAKRCEENPSRWVLSFPEWSAEIQMEQDELKVIWEKDGERKQCCFSYGLTRGDVEAVMTQGP